MLVQSIATVRKKQKIINEINLPCVKCVREESKQSCNFPIVLVIDVFRVQMTKAVHNLLKDHNIFTCTKQYHISISRWTMRSNSWAKTFMRNASSEKCVAVDEIYVKTPLKTMKPLHAK